MTVLAAIGYVCWALIDTSSLGDQHPLFARIFPFSPMFSSTLEMCSKISTGLEGKLVDRLVTHVFSRMINRQTTGDLLGAPAELEMSFYVLLDGRIAYPWAGALNLRRPVDRVFAQNA